MIQTLDTTLFPTMRLRTAVGRYFREKNLKARPSKTYFHRIFNEDVRRFSKCERAADIASADFKNSHLFNSKMYLGVDIDKGSLHRGIRRSGGNGSAELINGPLDIETLARHNTSDRERTDVGVHADFRNDIFPHESLDLIVSSHTFGHIPESDHVDAIENFCEWLRPGGTLLLQLGNENWYGENMRVILENTFENVDEQRYRNIVSEKYEMFLADEEGSVTFPSDGSDLRLFLMNLGTLCLLPLEQSEILEGKSVYVRCLNHK